MKKNNNPQNYKDMSKLVKDIQTNPKPMFYACVLEGLRKIALKCGYANTFIEQD